MRHIPVRARTTDPETSHQAALQFEANQPRAQRSVLTVVKILETFGKLSDFQIRQAWPDFWGDGKWSYTLPCKARLWAREQGLVKLAGFGMHEGRRVRMWELGRDELSLTQREVCPTCGKAITRHA